MGLTEAEKAQLAAERLSLSDGLRQLSGQQAGTLLLKTLCAVAHSDGRMHPAEVEFVHKVTQRLGGEAFVLPQSEWGAYEREVFDALNELG